VVETGATRQSYDPSIMLLFKLVLEVVADARGLQELKTMGDSWKLPAKGYNSREAD
jgi:hypothetical protein